MLSRSNLLSALFNTMFGTPEERRAKKEELAKKRKEAQAIAAFAQDARRGAASVTIAGADIKKLADALIQSFRRYFSSHGATATVVKLSRGLRVDCPHCTSRRKQGHHSLLPLGEKRVGERRVRFSSWLCIFSRGRATSFALWPRKTS